MKLHSIIKGNRQYAPFNGLRIDLSEKDIEEFTHVKWIELYGSDTAEWIVCEIAKECDNYLRRKDEHDQRCRHFES